MNWFINCICFHGVDGQSDSAVWHGDLGVAGLASMTFVSLLFSCYDTKSSLPYISPIWYPPRSKGLATITEFTTKDKLVVRHLTLRPGQSQVKIRGCLKQTESTRRTKRSLCKPTEALQSVFKSHGKIYSKESTFPELEDSRARRLTLPERLSESLLRPQSDRSSPFPFWSNVNQVLTSNVLLDLMIV